MNEPLFAATVLTDGEFDVTKIPDREIVYTTPEGMDIIRFALGSGENKRSYIYKPLTNPELSGREDWVYQHLLPQLTCRYPSMVARSKTRHGNSSWTIFEDMGTLTHEHRNGIIQQAAIEIRKLHRLSAASVPDWFRPQKPLISEVTAIVTARNRHLAGLLIQQGMPATVVDGLIKLLKVGAAVFTDETVVSHGDLHMGNVGERGGQLVILDWEHVHVNSLYWDLYHLLDMTHPDFPRQVTPELRRIVLDAYLEERRREGWNGDSDLFHIRYSFYAAVYSAWMLLLIDSDLKDGRWIRDRLLVQQAETFSSLESCAYQLLNRTKETR